MSQRSMVGRVVSNKMQKTVIVEVEKTKHHPLYKKTYRRSIRYKVHDEKSEAKVGDSVTIVETRPLSKEKKWRLLEITRKAHITEADKK